MSLLRRLAGRLLPSAAHDAGRWVVLDVESTGLNPNADRLLAIAAIAVARRLAAQRKWLPQ